MCGAVAGRRLHCACAQAALQPGEAALWPALCGWLISEILTYLLLAVSVASIESTACIESVACIIGSTACIESVVGMCWCLRLVRPLYHNFLPQKIQLCVICIAAESILTDTAHLS